MKFKWKKAEKMLVASEHSPNNPGLPYEGAYGNRCKPTAKIRHRHVTSVLKFMGEGATTSFLLTPPPLSHPRLLTFLLAWVLIGVF